MLNIYLSRQNARGPRDGLRSSSLRMSAEVVPTLTGALNYLPRQTPGVKQRELFWFSPRVCLYPQYYKITLGAGVLDRKCLRPEFLLQ